MNFHLKHRSTECPAELREAIEHKMARFERLVPENAYLELEIIQHVKVQQDGDKSAEVILDIPGVKPVIRFRAEGYTFLEAVDQALDKLDAELGKQRDKLTDHSYHGASAKELVADAAHRAEM